MPDGEFCLGEKLHSHNTLFILRQPTMLKKTFDIASVSEIVVDGSMTWQSFVLDLIQKYSSQIKE